MLFMNVTCPKFIDKNKKGEYAGPLSTRHSPYGKGLQR